jgi:tRNA 2-thiouridine synthesizing protein A
MTAATRKLDARGLNCPLPILRTRKALDQLTSGEVLEVIASDPGSVKDMASFCAQTGNILLSSGATVNDYAFLIEKA